MTLVAGMSLACGNGQAASTSYSGDELTVSDVQPLVSDVAFVNSGDGTQIKLAGTVPSGEVERVWVNLYDTSGAQIPIDNDADGAIDGLTFEFILDQAAEGGRYFVELSLSHRQSANVAKVSIQVVDQLGNISEPTYANLDDVPHLKEGASCDPRGFDVCPEGTQCSQEPGDWQAHCIPVGAQ